VDEFMAWIREDRRPLRTMHDGRAIVAVIEAAYRSLASGRVESVAPREPPAQVGGEGGDEPQGVAIR
jgi:hypothetical protein